MFALARSIATLFDITCFEEVKREMSASHLGPMFSA